MGTKNDLNKLAWATQQAALGDKLDAIITLVNELRADFLAHTHMADGANVGVHATSTPRTDAAAVAGGTAMTVTAPTVDALT